MSSDALRLTASLPPSANNAYPNRRDGKRTLSRAGRAYKREVALLAMHAGAPKLDIQPPYSLTIALYFPDHRKRDASNYIKVLEDALMASIAGDDRYVEELSVSRRVDTERPRAEVELYGSVSSSSPADGHGPLENPRRATGGRTATPEGSETW